MTRKDYNILANAIKRSNDGQDNVRMVVEDIADALAHDNPNFDHERFIKACGFNN